MSTQVTNELARIDGGEFAEAHFAAFATSKRSDWLVYLTLMSIGIEAFEMLVAVCF